MLYAYDDEIRSLKGFDENAQNSGKLDIIVSLKVPKTLQATSSGSQEGWQNLGDYVNEVQSKAISDLGWQNFNDVVRYKTIPAMAKSVDRGQMQKLLDSEHVEAVFVDEFRSVQLVESSRMIGLPRALQKSTGGSGQVVAILDTGIDGDHPFLRGKVIDEACFSKYKDCPNGAAVMYGPGSGKPCKGNCSHGTHVAGIVAGSSNRMTGVAPQAKLLSVQVFSVTSRGVGALDSDILKGLEWVYLQRKKHNISSINMSLGGKHFSNYCDHLTHYKQMIDLLREAGIATVVASGNEHKLASISVPACISTAVSVGSIEKNSRVSTFSNSYPKLNILAPGGKIFSAVPGGSYETKSGTSMAAPHIAGAWAVLKASYPKASVNQIESALTQTEDTIQDHRNKRVFPVLSLSNSLTFLERLLVGEPTPWKPKPEKKDHRIDGILIEVENENENIR